MFSLVVRSPSPLVGRPLWVWAMLSLGSQRSWGYIPARVVVSVATGSIGLRSGAGGGGRGLGL